MKPAVAVFGDPKVRLALLGLALAIGVLVAFLLIRQGRNTPPVAGLGAPDVVFMAYEDSSDPTQVHKVEIHRGGEVVFEGGPEVLLPGRHVYRPPPERVAAFFALVDNSRFRWLRPRYSAFLGGDYTTTVCLRQGVREKCVSSRGSRLFGGRAPAPFGEIAVGVDQLASPRRWLTADDHTLELFGEHGIDPRSIGGQRLVVQAARSLSPDAMRALIAAGFPIDRAARVERYDPAAATPLAVALDNRRDETARILIAAGALNSVTPAARARLAASAARGCRPDMLDALLDTGAHFDFTATPPNAFWCEHWASEKEALATAKLLLDRGASPSARDEQNRTPLHRVTSAAVASLLLRRGADPNVRDNQGFRPLDAADTEDLAVALVEGGAAVGPPPSGAPAAGSIDQRAADKGWTRLQALLAERRTSGAAS